MNAGRRVVVTGVGVVSPIGIGKKNFWTSLLQGNSGIKPISCFDASTYPTTIAGEIQDFDPTDFISHKDARRMDRSVQMIVASAVMALEDSGLTIATRNSDRCGVFTGTAIGGQAWAFREYEIFKEKGVRRINPFTAISTFPNASSAQLSHRFGLQGPSVTISSGCASSTIALGYALDNLRMGRIDVALVGGTEAPLDPGVFGAYCAARVMTPNNQDPSRVPRPFDSQRNGIVLSEGAAVLVCETLERAVSRGARVYAEIAGWAHNTDTFSMSMMDPGGLQAIMVMRSAVADAGVSIDDIDYVQAHAPGTIGDDRVEMNSLQSLLGERVGQVWVSAIKSMLGHTQGACGAIETVAAVLSISKRVILQTINCANLEPDCLLRINRERPQMMDHKIVLLNTFGFGGKNASLVLRRVDY